MSRTQRLFGTLNDLPLIDSGCSVPVTWRVAVTANCHTASDWLLHCPATWRWREEKSKKSKKRKYLPCLSLVIEGLTLTKKKLKICMWFTCIQDTLFTFLPPFSVTLCPARANLSLGDPLTLVELPVTHCSILCDFFSLFQSKVQGTNCSSERETHNEHTLSVTKLCPPLPPEPTGNNN